jgi:hypothetical protein
MAILHLVKQVEANKSRREGKRLPAGAERRRERMMNARSGLKPQV